MTASYLSVNGVRLYAEISGSGDPIVFLHGWTLDLSMWNPQADEFAKRHKVIRYDRRGYGKSSGFASLDRDVEDLRAVLDHLKIERATIVGMSQAGRVALRFSVAHPHRVKALVLHGAPLDGFNLPRRGADALPIQKLKDICQNEGMPAFREYWIQHPLMALHTNDPGQLAALRHILENYSGADLLAPSATPESQPDLTARLPDVTIPALIILGEYESRWLHLVGDIFVYGLGNAKKVIIPGGGHLVNIEYPAAYNAALQDFLQ